VNPTLARAVKASLEASGHYLRHLRRDRFPGVAVLCYHGVRDGADADRALPFAPLHVLVAELAAHCRVLRRACHPIGLAEWRAAQNGGPPLPARPALVTFDDGYRSVFTLARPILEEHAIPAVCFASTDPIATGRLFWFDALARTRGDAAVEALKSVPHGAWAEEVTRVSVDAAAEDPLAPLTPEEVRGLATSADWEVGSHGASHAILARASLDTQRDEIARSRERLEAWTGRAITAFAYPNGRPRLDYTSETVDLLRDAGFDVGFTTRSAFAAPGEPPLERSRFLMLAGVSGAELAHRLCYSWRS